MCEACFAKRDVRYVKLRYVNCETTPKRPKVIICRDVKSCERGPLCATRSADISLEPAYRHLPLAHPSTSIERHCQTRRSLLVIWCPPTDLSVHSLVGGIRWMVEVCTSGRASSSRLWGMIVVLKLFLFLKIFFFFFFLGSKRSLLVVVVFSPVRHRCCCNSGGEPTTGKLKRFD